VKRYNLGDTDPSQYSSLTEAERLAWLNPEPHSYHSFHVERMGEHTYRWRDSRSAHYYIGTLADLADALISLQLRKLNPRYLEEARTTQVLKVLSQDEIDDLFADL
jgi:hypothetical protein